MFATDVKSPQRCEVFPGSSAVFVQHAPEVLNLFAIWGIWNMPESIILPLLDYLLPKVPPGAMCSPGRQHNSSNKAMISCSVLMLVSQLLSLFTVEIKWTALSAVMKMQQTVVCYILTLCSQKQF